MPDGRVQLPSEIDVTSVKRMLDENAEFLLLDCRTVEEAEMVSIAGSKLVPMDQLPDRVAELELHKRGRIVVYCHLGGRSQMVTEWLRQQGFQKAQVAYLLGNEPARRSYERVGFETVSERRDPDFEAALQTPGVACMHMDL